MRKWARRIAWAIVGLVGLATCIRLYQFYQAAEQQHASYNYQPAEKLGFRINGATKTPTPYYKPSCQNPYSQEDADLCAQWAAVDQVAESNRLNSLNLRMLVLTLFLTTIGTGALVWTLFDTRRTSRAELRAYVWAKPISFNVNTDRSVTVGFRLTNNGQTPAYECAHYGVVDTFENDEVAEANIRNDPPTRGRRVNTPLHPGEDPSVWNVSSDGPIGVERLRKVADGALNLYVHATVIYTDTFGRPHRTRVCQRIVGFKLENSKADWQMMPFHNDAT
jgi:hypothetical protein